MEEFSKNVKAIGRHGECGKEHLEYFLPNYPTLRGSEPIFRIGHANANDCLDSEAEVFIKGLHLIEMAYKEACGHDFGFGSPSPTAKVIDALEKNDKSLAMTLRNWVLERGGNYYINRERKGIICND